MKKKIIIIVIVTIKILIIIGIIYAIFWPIQDKHPYEGPFYY